MTDTKLDYNYMFLEAWDDNILNQEETQIVGSSLAKATIQTVSNILESIDPGSGKDISLDTNEVMEKMLINFQGKVEKNRLLLLIMDKFLVMCSLRVLTVLANSAPEDVKKDFRPMVEEWFEDAFPLSKIAEALAPRLKKGLS